LLFHFQRKPDLEISSDGIQASVWGDAHVRWDEIERVFVVSRQGIDFLCLTLRRPEDFRARGGSLVKLVMESNRQAGLGDLMFRPATLRLHTNEILKLIELMTDWHKSELKPRPSAVRYRMD
jgi:hypothetical protein